MTALDRTTLDRLAESQSPRRAEQMNLAFDVYEKLHMPTGVEEAWRYVEMDVDLADMPLADRAGSPLPPGAFLTAVAEREAEAVIVDGHVVLVRSGNSATVVRLSELDDDDVSSLANAFPVDHDKFAAARAAFGVDGVVVRVGRNQTIDKPIVIDIQATSDTASFPYLAIETGENAEVPVLVVYRTGRETKAVLSPQVTIRTGDGARVRFLAVQSLGFHTTGVIHQQVVVGRDATARIGEVGLGGKLGRLDLSVIHEGNGGSSEVVGLFFGEYDQTLDYRMVINHRGKNTSSNVFLKGAVEDDAQSVFTGLLKIEKDATRTSAFETNRNLVLSDGAKAHSVPNLEILCDDVVCGHGSSVGPLEEEHLYYLQSRGMSKERAEQLLIRGFFQEVIDRLPVAGLEVPIRDEVFGRFREAQAEGRVS